MIKKAFCIFLLLSAFTVFGQTYEADKIAIIKFLTKHCSFEDGNPIHQEEADEVNLLVRKIFEKQYSSDDIPNLITQTLQLFYDNSVGEFEDSPDYTRMTTRRSMCYMALAFLSEEYRYRAFLEDTRDNLNKLASDLNGEMLLIVNMIELYRELNWEYASNKAIEHIILLYQDDLKDKEKEIGNKSFLAEYNKILSDIANFIRETEK